MDANSEHIDANLLMLRCCLWIIFLCLDLKEYSNWPTYPQLYINGELVGGVDIFKELVASGELKSMLPDAEEDSKVSLEDRLKSLVNREKVMLFMKGAPDEPRCGFSRTIVGILKSKGFVSADIILLDGGIFSPQ